MKRRQYAAVAVAIALLTGCGQSQPTGTPSSREAQPQIQPPATSSVPSPESPSSFQPATPTIQATSTPAATTAEPSTATTESAALPQTSQMDQPAKQKQAAPGEQVRSNLSAGTISTQTMYSFLESVLKDVDNYWTGVWTAAGYPQPTVKYYFPKPGESYPLPANCGGASDDNTAGYCPADDTIYFSQQMATQIWNGQVKTNNDPATGVASGDFSVAFAVAHEYAHNLQNELQLESKYPTLKLELHADCWAGIWANSAYYKGYLQGTDVEEAEQATRLLGDYLYSNPDHHGTPQQRVSAFMTGYNSGTPSSCNPWLTDNYQ